MLQDSELIILQSIQEQEMLSQRDLAEKAELSLGMTNAIIKKLISKGWVLVKKLNSRKLIYALSPEGLEEISRRTYRYMQKTFKDATIYRSVLEMYFLQKKREGFRTIVLYGNSDFDYIIDYVCDRHGLSFMKTVQLRLIHSLLKEPGTFVVCGESEVPIDVTGSCIVNLKTIMLSVEN